MVTSPQVPFHCVSLADLLAQPLCPSTPEKWETPPGIERLETVTGLIVDHVSSSLVYFLYSYCNKLFYTHTHIYIRIRKLYKGILLPCKTFDSTNIVAAHIRQYRMFSSSKTDIFVSFFSPLLFFRSRYTWQEGTMTRRIYIGRQVFRDWQESRGIAVARRSLVRIINSESEY